MKNSEQNTNVKETVTASFDIPSRIYLFGRRPFDETKEIVVEHLRNQAMSICDLLAYGASCVQSGNFDEQTFIDAVGVLANIASNHIEAIEIVERDKDGELKRASLEAKSEPTDYERSPEHLDELLSLSSNPKETTLSEMVFNRMADRLVAVIENPAVPETAKEAIMSIAFTVASNASDDETRAEYIKRTFAKSMEGVPFNAANAYIQSIQAVMESCIPDEIYAPILKANVEKFNEK